MFLFEQIASFEPVHQTSSGGPMTFVASPPASRRAPGADPTDRTNRTYSSMSQKEMDFRALGARGFLYRALSDLRIPRSFFIGPCFRMVHPWDFRLRCSQRLRFFLGALRAPFSSVFPKIPPQEIFLRALPFFRRARSLGRDSLYSPVPDPGYFYLGHGTVLLRKPGHNSSVILSKPGQNHSVPK